MTIVHICEEIITLIVCIFSVYQLKKSSSLHGKKCNLLLSMFSSSFYVIVPPCHVLIFTTICPKYVTFFLNVILYIVRVGSDMIKYMHLIQSTFLFVHRAVVIDDNALHASKTLGTTKLEKTSQHNHTSFLL